MPHVIMDRLQDYFSNFDNFLPFSDNSLERPSFPPIELNLHAAIPHNRELGERFPISTFANPVPIVGFCWA